MKKIILGLAAVTLLSTPAFATGLFYNDTVEPTTLGQQPVKPCKVGKATCANYMGVVQLGDCSYEAAMKNGHISEVNHHDTQTTGWFFYKRIITKVYGE